jgi:hypothetical protein
MLDSLPQISWEPRCRRISQPAALRADRTSLYFFGIGSNRTVGHGQVGTFGAARIWGEVLIADRRNLTGGEADGVPSRRRQTATVTREEESPFPSADRSQAAASVAIPAARDRAIRAPMSAEPLGDVLLMAHDGPRQPAWTTPRDSSHLDRGGGGVAMAVHRPARRDGDGGAGRCGHAEHCASPAADDHRTVCH